jgi:hypothetical protein
MINAIGFTVPTLGPYERLPKAIEPVGLFRFHRKELFRKSTGLFDNLSANSLRDLKR